LAPSIFTYYDLKPTRICNKINFDKQIRRETFFVTSRTRLWVGLYSPLDLYPLRTVSLLTSHRSDIQLHHQFLPNISTNEAVLPTQL